MKCKILLAVLAAIGICGMVSAASQVTLQVGFWFDVPQSISQSTVNGGASFGLPVSAGWRVKGAELSLLASASQEIDGFQYALLGYNSTRTLYGCQLSFLNFVKDGIPATGVQIGLYNQSRSGGWQFGLVNNCWNNARFQLGLVNINTNGWLPVMILVNFAR